MDERRSGPRSWKDERTLKGNNIIDLITDPTGKKIFGEFLDYRDDNDCIFIIRVYLNNEPGDHVHIHNMGGNADIPQVWIDIGVLRTKMDITFKKRYDATRPEKSKIENLFEHWFSQHYHNSGPVILQDMIITGEVPPHHAGPNPPIPPNVRQRTIEDYGDGQYIRNHNTTRRWSYLPQARHRHAKFVGNDEEYGIHNFGSPADFYRQWGRDYPIVYPGMFWQPKIVERLPLHFPGLSLREYQNHSRGQVPLKFLYGNDWYDDEVEYDSDSDPDNPEILTYSKIRTYRDPHKEWFIKPYTTAGIDIGWHYNGTCSVDEYRLRPSYEEGDYETNWEGYRTGRGLMQVKPTSQWLVKRDGLPHGPPNGEMWFEGRNMHFMLHDFINYINNNVPDLEWSMKNMENTAWIPATEILASPDDYEPIPNLERVWHIGRSPIPPPSQSVQNLDDISQIYSTSPEWWVRNDEKPVGRQWEIINTVPYFEVQIRCKSRGGRRRVIRARDIGNEHAKFYKDKLNLKF